MDDFAPFVAKAQPCSHAFMLISPCTRTVWSEWTPPARKPRSYSLWESTPPAGKPRSYSLQSSLLPLTPDTIGAIPTSRRTNH